MIPFNSRFSMIPIWSPVVMIWSSINLVGLSTSPDLKNSAKTGRHQGCRGRRLSPMGRSTPGTLGGWIRFSRFNPCRVSSFHLHVAVPPPKKPEFQEEIYFYKWQFLWSKISFLHGFHMTFHLNMHQNSKEVVHFSEHHPHMSVPVGNFMNSKAESQVLNLTCIQHHLHWSI